MSKIANFVKLKAAPEQSGAFKEALIALAAETHKEPGCIMYELFHGEDNTWMVAEIWRDAKALDAHIAAPHTQMVIKLFEKALAEPPRVETFTPESSTAGN
ncbi:MAG: antibiotic biosynthesis monooxygenase [Marinicaulis sp.]|nr:antibiotic biosynthesis monooxygenase [Marinicaulis sp.]NNE41886.1 antibiotic biosynthesis monooxygenase [Marinicaulis sp.]